MYREHLIQLIRFLGKKDGASGGTWTRMSLRTTDFKSVVYTSSTTLAFVIFLLKMYSG